MSLTALSWQHKQPLFLPWLALMVLGLIMVSTASTGVGEHLAHNYFYFIIRQVIYVFLGLITFYVVSLILIRLLQQWDVVFLLAAIVALIVVGALLANR